MNLMELQKQIKNNSLDKLYIFTGEETKIMKIFLERMATVNKSEVKSLSAAVNYYNKLGAKTLVTAPTIYVIRDDNDYIKQDETVWNKLVKRQKNSVDIVVFIYSNLDKRTKFYKFFEKYLIEFVTLSEDVVAGYLVKDYGLKNDVARYISHNCEAKYNLCSLEAHKFRCYQEALEAHSDDVFRLCKENCVFTILRTENVLQSFINSALTKDLVGGGICLQRLDVKQDPPLKVLAYLYNSFRALFDVVCYEYGMSNKKGESVSNFWAVKNVEIFAPRWSPKEVKYVIDYIQYLESGIKFGQVESDLALKLFLFRIHYVDLFVGDLE